MGVSRRAANPRFRLAEPDRNGALSLRGVLPRAADPNHPTMLRSTALLSTSLLLAPTLFAQRIAEIEPNDTPAQAQAILPGQQIVATFSTTTDEEWFSFTLT